MLTITCSLKFPNGKTVRAQTSAVTPYDDNDVIYSGAVDLLPRQFKKAGPSLLKLLFKNIASETGAELTTSMDGCFDVGE